MSATLAVAVFLGAYVLIATEKANRVAVALTGAGLLLALGVVSSADAFNSEEYGVDWDVIFLLLGMMVIVGVIKQTGLFDFLAIWSAKRAGGRPFRILVTLTTITAVASALLDNVTTVLLVAPVTFLICERLDLPAAPFLIAQALASNIGGTATLIGDPPQHHHRQRSRPVLHRLPGPPRPAGGRAHAGVHRPEPLAVPVRAGLPARPRPGPHDPR